MGRPAEQSFSPYGGRRFVLTIAASIAYTLLFMAGLLTEAGYITLQMMTVGAYMAASASQHVAHEIAEGKRNATPEK